LCMHEDLDLLNSSVRELVLLFKALIRIICWRFVKDLRPCNCACFQVSTNIRCTKTHSTFYYIVFWLRCHILLLACAKSNEKNKNLVCYCLHLSFRKYVVRFAVLFCNTIDENNNTKNQDILPLYAICYMCPFMNRNGLSYSLPLLIHVMQIQLGLILTVNYVIELSSFAYTSNQLCHAI
jgi:hypothetical protein